MANSQVVINDETFDLVTIPDTKSKMVLNAKDLLLGSLDLQSLVDDLVTVPDAKSNMVLNAKDLLPGSLDLQSLVDDLGKLVNFIRVAYNGVAGNTEVQIKVQRVGYKIAMLADKSAITVYQFKSASQSVLQELKGTYQYLLDGLEEMALETLSMLTEEAAAMVMAADELHSDFEKATDDVRDALENTQKAKGAEEEEKKTREKERQEFESRVKQAGQRQKNALEAEAKAQALYDQAQAREDKAMDKQDSLLSALASVFTGTISAAKGAATRNVQKAAEEMKKIGSGYIEAMKMANQEKMKHLDELQKEREVRQKAIVEWIEFAEKIKRCEDDNKLAEAAIEALHGSIGALKSLSAIMMKATVFWQQMKSHCESLAKREMQRSVETAMKYPEEKRLKVWTSKGFKEKAVQYYSKWVALDDVCGVYMLQIRDTSQHLYNYLTENPTIEQAKNNVRQLATEFAKDLKQAQGKLAEDQQKALDEKKSLEEK